MSTANKQSKRGKRKRGSKNRVRFYKSIVSRITGLHWNGKRLLAVAVGIVVQPGLAREERKHNETKNGGGKKREREEREGGKKHKAP